MAEGSPRFILISNFNLDPLRNLITRAGEDVPVSSAEFGQVYEPLLNASHACWADSPGGAFIWTQPQAISNGFGRLLRGENAAIEEILADVRRFVDAILSLASRINWVFVASWTLPFYHRGMGMLDLTDPRGHALALTRMNLELAERLAGRNVFLLNAQKWMERAGTKSHDPRLWYMAKIPFGTPVLESAAEEIAAALSALRGTSRKVIVVDLDDTLWGGIVGDTGKENLRLGGHDPIGEAFVDFQRGLRALSKRGILLAIASKNEEDVALDAIRTHPEMILSIDDFSAWRINWGDKALGIMDIAKELNLGLQSFVFIDDNPVERARVREALPEVLVPDWPVDKTKYPRALSELRCFDQPTISTEDAARKQMYADERQRNESRNAVASIAEWVRSLDMTIFAEKLNATNLKRATQLLNKTNQMNLATRRLSEAELWAWSEAEDHEFWTFRVSDRFGDSGLTGLLGIEVDGRRARITDFVLSCRVMGRRVEETMLSVAVASARSRNLEHVVADYLSTAKNKPCLRFWLEDSGFSTDDGRKHFSWNASVPYPQPDSIHVEIQSSYLQSQGTVTISEC